MGPNELSGSDRASPWRILLDQMRSAVVLLLAAAAAAGLLLGAVAEGVAVLVVLVANTLTGFVTELRAARSMESLRHLVTTRAEVERDDRRDEIDARGLVPGGHRRVGRGGTGAGRCAAAGSGGSDR